jgi:hypothetical protein
MQLHSSEDGDRFENRAHQTDLQKDERRIVAASPIATFCRRAFLGVMAGWGAYCLFALGSEIVRFIRFGYFDWWEGVFYSCVAPFGLFDLFSRESWREFPLWVNLETLLSWVFILVGAVIAVLRTKTHGQSDNLEKTAR